MGVRATVSINKVYTMVQWGDRRNIFPSFFPICLVTSQNYLHRIIPGQRHKERKIIEIESRIFICALDFVYCCF